MSYGAIFGKTGKSGFYPTLTITPVGAVFTSVTATSSTGQEYNATQQDSQWFVQVNDFDTYTVTGNYTGGSVSQDVDVVVNQNYDVTLTVASTTLNDNSWGIIRAVADAGIGENYWAVGDAKQIDLSNKTIGTVTYSTFQPWVYILGFNHNAELEGQNMIHFGCFQSAQTYSATGSIALNDSYYANNTSTVLAFTMNISPTNQGGWQSSIMRNQVLDSDTTNTTSENNSSFLAALPSDLQSVLKQCIKYTDNVGGGSGNIQSNVTPTQDWVFLLSEYEIQGAITHSNTYEANYQKQYQYYINGNSKIKRRQSNTNNTAYWWNRSSVPMDSGNFCRVNTNGSPGSTSAGFSIGLAPAFCV